MKNLPTTKELRDKYNPDAILYSIEDSFKKNYEKLVSCLGHTDSPLISYSKELQISLLETPEKSNDELINDIASTLKDAVYFLSLKKKQRTLVTQRMRSYQFELIDNQLMRIRQLLDDPEIGSPKYGKDPNHSHKGFFVVTKILSRIANDLELELKHWKNLPRVGYLTGLQHSMGLFFISLRDLGMKQKDQITLVQLLFDHFKVDWEEGDRDKIKVSLQQPALLYYENTQHDKRQINNIFFSKTLSDDLVADLISHAKTLKNRLRRF